MNERLYTDLADWWPLISSPADYAEEAELYRRVMLDTAGGPVRTVLELGSGGGNNASHLKRHFEMTLVDRSPGMLAVSRALNPECEHITGDMTTVRLDRTFDAVFIHDAVEYLTERSDLERTAETAFVHCRAGGAVLFVPDHIRETFVEGTSHGGHDGRDRAARYLEWTHDPDPEDSSYLADYVFVLRTAAESEVVFDRHELGLFSQAEWLEIILGAGFSDPEPDIVDLADGDRVHLFPATRPR